MTDALVCKCSDGDSTDCIVSARLRSSLSGDPMVVAAAELVQRSTWAQGLTVHCVDDDALERVAAVVRSAR